MGVITTRRLEQLRAECENAGVPYSEEDGRLELMDKLRSFLGGYDPGMEIDPMKAKDLKPFIKVGAESPYEGLSKWLNNDHIAEPKLDGVRLRMFMGLTGNTLNSGRRSVKTMAYTVRTDNFPHLRDAVVRELAGVILDGELLAPSAKITSHTGVQTNSLLNASVALTNANPAGSQATQAKYGKALYHVFDILAGPGGESLQDNTWEQRRQILEEVIETIQRTYPDNKIDIIPVWPATVESIERSLMEGYEGVVLKQKAGVYKPGKRGYEWMKVKPFSTADAFIVGYNPGENANEGLVGSLNLAVMEEVTDPAEKEALFKDQTQFSYFEQATGKVYKPRPVAQVGNLIQEWRKEISAPDGSLKPELYGKVIEWLAQGIGKNGRARHAHMVRLRPDKFPEDCMADQLDIFPAV